jgi:response regulator RpfG family c-di-GMP phosphodiesterase
LHLPGLDGLELFRKLHLENPVSASIPFIFLSQVSDDERLLAGIELGVMGHIPKPLDMDIFVATVRSQLAFAWKQNKFVIEMLHTAFGNPSTAIDASANNVSELFESYSKIAKSAQKVERTLGLADSASFNVRTLSQAHLVARCGQCSSGAYRTNS